MALRFETLTATGGGAERLADRLDDIARLRIAVFRDWPYLYDGSMDYERRYMSRFAAARGAVAIAAFAEDGELAGDMVGVSTGVPLAAEHEEFVGPFSARGYDPACLFYCAETILLPAYRGQGAYRRFFEGREAHARRLNAEAGGRFTHLTFCGVVRPDDHPARPADWQPLDPVWRHFGYRPVDGLTTTFGWTDIGDSGETRKPMQFWIKPLEGAP